MLTTARDFWDAYTAADLVALERDADGTNRGERMYYGPGGLEDAGSVEPFELAKDALQDYDYEDDLTFSLCIRVPFTEALASVIEMPPMQEDTIPNQCQLMLALKLLRDPTGDPVPYHVKVHTRELIEAYAAGGVHRDRLMAMLRDLRPGRDANFDVVYNLVLDAVAGERLTNEQAAHLFCADTPHPEVDYGELGTIVLDALEEGEVTREKACAFMDALKPNASDYAEMEENGDVAAVHGERAIVLKAFGVSPTDDEINKCLLDVIENHENEDVMTVMTAVWAVGRHNHKAAIAPLIGMLDNAAMPRYADPIENALQFLCSGAELIPLTAFGFEEMGYTDEEFEEMDKAGDAFNFRHKYWGDQRPKLPADEEAWNSSNATSVFWEKRLRFVLSGVTAGVSPSVVQALETDEVPVVRIAGGGPEELPAATPP